MCALDLRPAIGTERLVLRPPTGEDAAAIAEFANDPGVAGMLSTWPYPYGQADAEAWLAKVARADPRARADFVIEHRQFGVMGLIGVGEDEPQADRRGRPELGYWLGRPFWNRGYATEAVRGALKWVKRDWRKNLVEAGHFADNPASGQVLCKAGFLYTGDVALKDSRARGQPVPTRMMVWLA